jgi:GNAT superfamily N-acetyltransferase
MVDEGVVRDINALIPQLKPAWDPASADDLAELLASESRVYVVRSADRIVGLTVMVPHRHLPGLRYHVEDVVVADGHRQRGLARRLLEHAMDDAPGDVRSFDLRSHASRAGAHELYESLGFHPSDTTVFRREVTD